MSDAIHVTADIEALGDAMERRFALAQQVGRLTGAIKLALGKLDAAALYPAAAPSLAVDAARTLRLALELEDGQ